MPRVVHFEIPVDQSERATSFYSKVFGWSFQKWNGPMEYWLIKTGDSGQPGINGGMYNRSIPSPVNTVVNTIDVPSLDDFVAKVVANGGTAMTSKMSIPGVGYHLYCRDTEGNIFGLIQFDQTAR